MNSTVTLPRVGALVCLLVFSACSSSTTPSTPSTTTTPPASSTGPGTSTPTSCSFSLSATSLNVAAVGGPSTITVTTGTGCVWSASTSASFITLTGAGGVGTVGNNSVVVNVAQDPGSDRTGTVTIAGQTLTVNQTGAAIIVSFSLFDPSAQVGPTNVCRLRGGSSNSPTTCTFADTSRSNSSSFFTNWAWNIQYTYDGKPKTFVQSSPTITSFQLTELCGLAGSAPGGATIPMSVSLTVTDQNGVMATGTAGQGTIPAMALIAYACGT